MEYELFVTFFRQMTKKKGKCGFDQGAGDLGYDPEVSESPFF
jgi:hypothetical protein